MNGKRAWALAGVVGLLALPITTAAWGAPIIHETGKSVQVFATGPSLQYVNGLALRPGGGLYASTEAGQILSILPTGEVQPVADISASATTLSNIAVDNDGKILVGDADAKGSNNIWEVSPAIGSTTLVYGYCYAPTDIHLDSTGNMLVVGRLGTKGVYRIARDGSWCDLVFQSGDQWTPTGIDLDAQGNMYVAYRESGIIYKVPPVGNPSLITCLPAGQSSQSQLALCLAPSGDLFVANDETGNIYKIDSTGTTATLFASGIDRPGYMTFDSWGNMFIAAEGESTVYEVLPEPATLSLLALGGLALIRRKRK